MSVTGLNIQPHNSVLPVAKELNLTVRMIEDLFKTPPPQSIVSDIFRRFKFSTTPWYVNRFERVILYKLMCYLFQKR